MKYGNGDEADELLPVAVEIDRIKFDTPATPRMGSEEQV